MKKTPKKQKSIFKKIVSWLHLWPSLVAGIIVLFVCITGTIIVYADEIMELAAGEALYVEAKDERISHEKIFDVINNINPNYKISEIVFYKDPKRTFRLRVFDLKEKNLFMMYMDPYTGNILKTDHTIYFFYITAHLHAQLLAGSIGGWIVVISTIVFLIGCITGLILWWPKKWNKSTRKASFTIKWKAKFKRLNYDLHNVLGFYTLPFSIILSLTGLIIFFHPLMNFTVKVSGGGTMGVQEALPAADTTKVSKDLVAYAYKTLKNEYPTKKAVNSWVYRLDKLGAFSINSGKPGLKSMENVDYTIYDRYTGEKIMLQQEQIIHEKVENTVWQLHMGQWWGQIGKLITFLTGIIATSLSVTGFLIWWGKQKKKTKVKTL
ncbi:PepSY-associated TM helix domain-containing protein [Tenacibaculum sp. IB213877]|uniref:PepSY-associated TM helix domain-containing protein n=1 Tax=Tenacibaculum sp. IB213877 TaxID=3097351 RepID=UPI002A5A828F|nr:PepSY-associated TM helix domain-containing protein [Tenacibaculum sp. IB213877]MDY0780984.1 PepSY-associated TM helix domain-containing protein [Tenacibaculum sp. IB213877]